MLLPSPIYSRRARASLAQSTTFFIDNAAAFGNFTQYMITSAGFTWRLKSEQVQAHALKFPVVNGLSLSRDLWVAGKFLFLALSPLPFARLFVW
jgi:hypothetical protein